LLQPIVAEAPVALPATAPAQTHTSAAHTTAAPSFFMPPSPFETPSLPPLPNGHRAAQTILLRGEDVNGRAAR
jgi:hypothetical protein